MTTSAVYPAGISPALGHLFASGNEVQIFVEDTSNRNVWRNVIRKFLPAGAAFSNPIPLGGRDKVIEECRLDQEDDGRKKLYIIDADLDLLQGTPIPNLNFLYRLKAYCIENYLFQEDALVRLAQVLDGNITEAEARAQLGFSAWKQRNGPLFQRLFVSYAIANLLDERYQTISFWIGNLAKDHPHNFDLCSKKINVRIFGLLRKVTIEQQISDVRNSRVDILSRAENMDFCMYTSGKNGLLNMMIARMKQLFGQMNEDQIKVLLSDYISPEIDPELQMRLQQVCA